MEKENMIPSVEGEKSVGSKKKPVEVKIDDNNLKIETAQDMIVVEVPSSVDVRETGGKVEVVVEGKRYQVDTDELQRNLQLLDQRILPVKDTEGEEVFVSLETDEKAEEGSQTGDNLNEDPEEILNDVEFEEGLLLKEAEDLLMELEKVEEEQKKVKMVQERADEYEEMRKKIGQLTRKKNKSVAEIEKIIKAKTDPKNYQELSKEGVITEEEKKSLGKITKKLQEVQEKGLARSEKGRELIKQLKGIVDKFNQEVAERIEERKSEIEQELWQQKNKVEEVYWQQWKEYEKKLAELEKDPYVVKELNERFLRKELSDKKEFLNEMEANVKSLQAKHENAFQNIMRVTEEDVKQRMIESLEKPIVKSLRAKHENAFRNIMRVTEEDVKQRMIERLERSDKNKFDYINKIRKALEENIIFGEEDERIKDPKEIIPWLPGRSPRSYNDSFGFISGRFNRELLKLAQEKVSDLEQEEALLWGTEEERQKVLKEEEKKEKSPLAPRAERLLKEIEQIEKENEALRILVGKKYKDRKKGILASRIWKAFAVRERNDQKGITSRLIEERKRIKELLAKGWKEVKVEIVKRRKNGKSFKNVLGGVVLMEKVPTKKGGSVWKVAEVKGSAAKAIRKGSTYPLNSPSLPQWLKKIASELEKENKK